MGRDSSSTVRMTTATQHTTLRAEQLAEMLRLSGSDSVELKLTVPLRSPGQRGGARGRPVGSADPPGGVLRHARSGPQRPAVSSCGLDAAKGKTTTTCIVKLRAGSIPSACRPSSGSQPTSRSRSTPCRAASCAPARYKGTLGQKDVKEVLAGQASDPEALQQGTSAPSLPSTHRPGSSWMTSRRSGPINLLKLKWAAEAASTTGSSWPSCGSTRMDRRILELSTKCEPSGGPEGVRREHGRS